MISLNESGFPDYLEVRAKFKLDSNKELAEYIDYMYNTYNSLYKAVFNMSPQRIKYLKELDDCLRDIYFDKLIGCNSATLTDETIIHLFANEPDKQAAVQKLYDIYMKECSDSFKRTVGSLFDGEK